MTVREEMPPKPTCGRQARTGRRGGGNNGWWRGYLAWPHRRVVPKAMGNCRVVPKEFGPTQPAENRPGAADDAGGTARRHPGGSLNPALSRCVRSTRFPFAGGRVRGRKSPTGFRRPLHTRAARLDRADRREFDEATRFSGSDHPTVREVEGAARNDGPENPRGPDAGTAPRRMWRSGYDNQIRTPDSTLSGTTHVPPARRRPSHRPSRPRRRRLATLAGTGRPDAAHVRAARPDPARLLADGSVRRPTGPVRGGRPRARGAATARRRLASPRAAGTGGDAGPAAGTGGGAGRVGGRDADDDGGPGRLGNGTASHRL